MPHVSDAQTGQQPALSRNQVQVTFATELANADVSVYALMKLLGHESDGYLAALRQCRRHLTRTAAAQNTLYGLLEQHR